MLMWINFVNQELFDKLVYKNQHCNGPFTGLTVIPTSVILLENISLKAMQTKDNLKTAALK